MLPKAVSPYFRESFDMEIFSYAYIKLAFLLLGEMVFKIISNSLTSIFLSALEHHRCHDRRVF